MLSRTFVVAMPLSAKKPIWEIFCTVIDNYGDIGVCWRLARQLAAEHGLNIRLWVDELSSFQRICPEIDPQSPIQNAHGVEIWHWEGDFVGIVPGDIIIETFACHLPERFVESMAVRNPKPVWINLDYLSAESWVTGCHALPSPHPRLPLTKHFFFPGFNETTGGLLRESNLEKQRRAYCASSAQQIDFWRILGMSPPLTNALTISLFAYENPAIADLLNIWAKGKEPICCLAPASQTLPAIEAFIGRPLRPGDTANYGMLEIRVLPFVPQSDYDRLLWSCDLNFVRGEDSFVRAQWAAKPMVWHIYPQDDNAHMAKLNAFLDIYCAKLPEASSRTFRAFHSAWNGEAPGVRITPEMWKQWMKTLPELHQLAADWEKNLSKQEDLCSSLVRFCHSKL